jgi:hypothetical protein
MGLGGSRFSREELDVYEACTCLSGAEILELHDKFLVLGGARAPDQAEEKTLRGAASVKRLSGTDVEAAAMAAASGGAAGRGLPVTKKSVMAQSELKNNPFKERLCEIFTGFEKGSEQYGDLQFDECAAAARRRAWPRAPSSPPARAHAVVAIATLTARRSSVRRRASRAGVSTCTMSCRRAPPRR